SSPLLHPLSLHDALPISSPPRSLLASASGLSALPEKTDSKNPLRWVYGLQVEGQGSAQQLRPLVLCVNNHQDASRIVFERLFERSEEHTSELQSPDHLVC